MITPPDLVGTWCFRRSIDDRFEDRTLTVNGTIEMTLDAPDRVRWSESGTLQLPDQRVPVSRTLLVEHDSDGWQVRFSDGRDFHPWQPGHEVVHPCGADTYAGHLDLPDRAPVRAWTITWQVSGPAKDYTMVTRLSR